VLTARIFEGEEVIVDVRGWSKGKGFQGVVKRHGFAVLADRPMVSITGAGHRVLSALHHSLQEYCPE
jgi:ribosomal protein L3